MKDAEFREIIYTYYGQHGRSLPWRENLSPYSILVSEMMLQQTQVPRVIPKYLEFMKTFPDISLLAAASLQDVLRLWVGLGYNRRAKYLHQAAQVIVSLHDNEVPQDRDELIKLKGVGINTAAAIRVYAFNIPDVFIETNIRGVFLYHFFPEQENVADSEVIQHVARLVDSENPREWYWALMDYGSWLKKEVGNMAKNSKHHSTQSKFEGSRRQLRGRVLRALVNRGEVSARKLSKRIADDRLISILEELEDEGLIVRKNNNVAIADS